MSTRTLVTGALSLAIAAGTAVVLPAAAGAEPVTPSNTVVINEVESNGDITGDWVELANPTDSDVDISGWTVIDNDPSHEPIVFGEGTTVPAGGYFRFYTDADAAGFGLGNRDSVTLSDAQGVVVDSTTWTNHASSTWGRVPDMTGAFADTGYPTPDEANVELILPDPPAEPQWPYQLIGFSAVDLRGDFTSDDMSGVDIDADGRAYVVNNGTGTLYVLDYNPSEGEYTQAASFVLRYPDGSGIVDAEGVTVGPDGVIYVAAERDNSKSSVSRPSVLRYELPADATEGTLSASAEYDMSALTGQLSANGGLEAIEYIPDALGGVFAVGVESTATVHFVQFGDDASVTELQKYVAPFNGVMALDYDEAIGTLRVICDDRCGGANVAMTFDGEKFVTDGVVHVEPVEMPDIANEGVATFRQEVPCTVDGVEGVAEEVRYLWADDDGTWGTSMRTALTAPGECVAAGGEDEEPGDDDGDTGQTPDSDLGSLSSVSVTLGSVDLPLPAFALGSLG